MRCTRKIDDDVIWVGADILRPVLFEAAYTAPVGMSYNSYLILDEKTALIDTVDRAVTDVFLENVEATLAGRRLDYLIVQHIEPDHSATLLDVLIRHPECAVVCSKRASDMLRAMAGRDIDAYTVGEGDTLSLGRHTLSFIMAPMVHWPEVMVSYDECTSTLFSADAFGSFGALGGALFADEAENIDAYLSEARRYYANIVGKYGASTRCLLSKLEPLDIKRICPLHGLVWRDNISQFVNKYLLWAEYRPEKPGAVIASMSVYGNTESAARALALALFERGITCVIHDVGVTEPSYIVSDAFRFGHLVFASVTYNGSLPASMESLISELASHGLSDRRIALIENGSWAPVAARRMRALLSRMHGISYVCDDVSFYSALPPERYSEIQGLADRIASDIRKEYEHYI